MVGSRRDFKHPDLEPPKSCPVSVCEDCTFYQRDALLSHLLNLHNVRVFNPLELRFIWEEYFNAQNGSVAENCVMGGDNDVKDRQLRNQLSLEKLQEMLLIQQQQRDANISLDCVFCRVPQESFRKLFRHMLVEHNFNVGNPENMVNVPFFVETLKQQLTAACCPQCEVTFKSSGVLRQHMRKKKHLKLREDQRFFDQFYIINYIDPNKTWLDYSPRKLLTSSAESRSTKYLGDKSCDGDENDENDENDDDEKPGEKASNASELWGDWVDELELISQKTTCLFDSEHVLDSPAEAIEHMKLVHGADIAAWKKAHLWDFYDLVKLVNFIRQRHMIDAQCWQCDFTQSSEKSLREHLSKSGHCIIQQSASLERPWNDLQFLFPVYDTDPLLFGLDDL